MSGSNDAADLRALLWPVPRLGEALEELARRARLRVAAAESPQVPATLAADGEQEQGRWLEWAAHRLGLEAEGLDAVAPEIEGVLAGAAPALVRVEDPAGDGYLLLLKSRGDTAHLLGPDLRVHRQSIAGLRRALCDRLEAPYAAEIDKLLAAAAVPPGRQASVRTAMLRDRLASRQVASCWMLRLSPARGFWDQLAQEGLRQRIVPIVAVFGILYGLEVLSWTLIGQGTLHGRVDGGWLAAWTLLVVSLVPLQWLGGWLDARFALDAGRIMKSRLLAGALRSDVETLRRQGAGELLGRVLESQALESLALNGGFGVLVALVELVFAATILAAGAGGWLHVALLLAWVAITLGLGWRYLVAMRAWTLERLRMTQALVERMVGHRTRLAQEQRARRDHEEDHELGNYVRSSQEMDRAVLPIVGVMPRGWILVALAGIAPAFVAGTASSVGIAVALGGMLLAGRALTGISAGVTALGRAAIAWKQVAGFFAAGDGAAREPFLPASVRTDEDGAPRCLVDARELSFQYQEAAKPVLRDIDLSIRHGERILLEGSSGGGKSTLAALLTGLRVPASGSLLLDGLDRQTLGRNWHRLAAEAPQFHENHILSGTVAFNLLMGRNWPASEEDLEEARALCEELGLGDLLERMPAGLAQTVGETGWQLSHGERSRIFLARALLQKAELTVLDESFAALDPETLARCLRCAFERAPTLMVIAHP
ncbi:ATP-binding cassette domain-containing protein [Ramlibacter alkalitolerans]|uniref:ABC transporter ATP-binding protein n=1 Tax=Ramlibacter alkalitolerans TaxID=2039631 RepID=A0ABS1JH57_9BURK|nr:ABC transporter ATP-binding protein [Ramlibacter alkalitolerans]MBL0423532.1 ABC transporter ATP-binding protein [Ramlibacter alkalitolerans]